MIEAAQSGDVALIKSILDQLSNDKIPFNVDDKGYTAAHWACYFDEDEIVNLFCRIIPTIFSISSSRNLSPLHISCLNSCIRSVRILIDSGEIFRELIEKKTQWGETALHLSSATGNAAITDLLLKAGAKLNAKDNWNRTPIDVAIEHGEIKVMNFFMENYYDEWMTVSSQRSSSAASSSLSSSTALMTQSTEFDLSKLANSTDQFKCIDSRVTALKDIQNQLLESTIFSTRLKLKNAETAQPILPLLTTKSLSSSLDQGVTNPSASRIDQPISSLVAPNPINNNIPSNSTPLLSLSKLMEYPGDPELLKKLLTQTHPSAVDPCGKDMFGWTALHKFASWDKVDLMHILLQHLDANSVTKTSSTSSDATATTFTTNSATVTPIIRTVDQAMNMLGGPDKGTCLHAAVDMGASRAVNYLLAYRQDNNGSVGGDCDTTTIIYPCVYIMNLDQVDKNGKTAVELAKVKGYTDIEQAIRNKMNE